MSKGSLQCIVATDLCLGIGYNNKLLYHNSEDMQRFKKYTTGKVIVMGGNTYRSLPCYPYPLPNRTTILLSSEEFKKLDIEDNKNMENLYICMNLSGLHMLINEFLNEGKDVVICGGSSLYEEFKDKYDEIYITILSKKFDKVDTYFPNPDVTKYELSKIEKSIDPATGISIKWILYKSKEK